ncbi:MAG: maleylpyruvate isomerase family mycothiol-dependent enzyme [Actinomycetota bacterium]
MTAAAMSDAKYTEWIDEAARELAELAAITGERAPVPACPGWTMRQLVAHVISGLSGWYTYNLVNGSEPLDYGASWSSQPPLPRGNADRLVWLVEAADRFVELVDSIDLDAPCYVFQTRRTARAWLHRAATETAIHLRDAREVLGDVQPWERARAAASIDETLRVMWHGALLLRGDLAAECVPDQAITVTTTDLDRAWRVTKATDDFIVESVESRAGSDQLSVSGLGDELISWLWGRTPTSQLATTGNHAAIEAWNLSAHI